jgi:hypothetical protein
MEFVMDVPQYLVMTNGYLPVLLALCLIIIACNHRLASKALPFTPSRRFLHSTRKGREIPSLRPRASKPIHWYYETYHQLHNLEKHPNILESARNELLAMISDGLSIALRNSQKGILQIDSYDTEHLRTFIHQEHEDIMMQWANYIDQRQLGKSSTLFGSIGEARTWLAQRAPAKLVDGAWLGHIHKITTPFSLRGVTKDTFQVLSEELGDGDPSKNHVYVYQQLLEEVGCPLPDPPSRDFIRPCYLEEMSDQRSWKSAVAQLLISLFPNEFLPEILGFNMHYELISLEAMIAARELMDIGVNPSYFLLHICIDNADTGHTAMALLNVINYLEMIKATECQKVFDESWKRVQAGYILSQTLAVSPCDGIELPNSEMQLSRAAMRDVTIDPLTLQIIEIFKNKSSISQKYHYQSKVRIGSRSLFEWLDSRLWEHDDHDKHLELLDALSRAKRWVCPGSGSESMLVQELFWGGRMFGAFTAKQVHTLIAWIDSLGPENSTWLYYRFTLREPVSSKDIVSSLQDPASHHPIPTTRSVDRTTIVASVAEMPNFYFEAGFPKQEQPLNTPCKSQLPDVVALWFAHIGLLENMINVPSRTATSLYSNILLVLRTQAGFSIETQIPASISEMTCRSSRSLVEIGLEILSRAQWTDGVNLSCLKDVLLLTKSHGQREESAKLAYNMLQWANHPDENLGLLLGLALAFLGLQEAVATSDEFLGEEGQAELKIIVERERKSLLKCMHEIKSRDVSQYRDFEKGYYIGRAALEDCLGKAARNTTKSLWEFPYQVDGKDSTDIENLRIVN